MQGRRGQAGEEGIRRVELEIEPGGRCVREERAREEEGLGRKKGGGHRKEKGEGRKERKRGKRGKEEKKIGGRAFPRFDKNGGGWLQDAGGGKENTRGKP